MDTLYDVLEVSQKASKEVIEKAYKILAKKYHPDLQSEENKKNAEEMMKKINDAYEVLGNEAKRKDYDDELEQKNNYKQQANSSQNRGNSETQQTHQNQQTQQTQQTSQYNSQYTQEEYENYEWQKMYQETDENNFISSGQKVKHHWTLKEIKTLLIIIIVLVAIIFIMWKIPFSHDWMQKIYENNVLVRICVNILIGIVNGFFTFIKLIFNKQ